MTIFFIKKAGSPAGGKAIVSFESEAVGIDLHGGRDIRDIKGPDIVIGSPFEIGFPELIVIQQSFPDFVRRLLVDSGDAPLVIVQ